MKNAEQSTEEFKKTMEARMRAYEIRGNILVLDPDDADYDIDLDSCSTYSQIVSWVMHLSEKTWFDREMLRTFISAACTHHGLDPRSRL
jgi:hypothetical protein